MENDSVMNNRLKDVARTMGEDVVYETVGMIIDELLAKTQFATIDETIEDTIGEQIDEIIDEVAMEKMVNLFDERIAQIVRRKMQMITDV